MTENKKVPFMAKTQVVTYRNRSSPILHAVGCVTENKKVPLTAKIQVLTYRNRNSPILHAIGCVTENKRVPFMAKIPFTVQESSLKLFLILSRKPDFYPDFLFRFSALISTLIILQLLLDHNYVSSQAEDL